MILSGQDCALGRLRGQGAENGDVGLDDSVGAVAVALHHHFQGLVAEQVGDLARRTSASTISEATVWRISYSASAGTRA